MVPHVISVKNTYFDHDRKYGPTFEDSSDGNVTKITVQLGEDAHLNCRISLLQDKTVSDEDTKRFILHFSEPQIQGIMPERRIKFCYFSGETKKTVYLDVVLYICKFFTALSLMLSMSWFLFIMIRTRLVHNSTPSSFK